MNRRITSKVIRLFFNPKSLAGILLSVGGVYWAFKDFQFSEFILSIQKVHLLYFILASFLLWVSVWLRAMRWKWLFKESKSPTVESLYRAELIGYFGNNVLPLRLGEILRIYLVGKKWNLSKGFVFGTVVLERILDTLTLALLAVILLMVYPLEGEIKSYVIWGGIISVVVISISFIIISRINVIKSDHPFLKTIKQIIKGLLSIRLAVVIPVVFSSLVIWGIYWMDVYLIQKAFQFNLDWAQTLTVLVISSLALSIPSAPGMIGTFHAAVKYTMVDLFAYTSNEGNSFAILMHAYGYILFTLLGAYYFMKSQFHNHAIQSVLGNNSKEKPN